MQKHARIRAIVGEHKTGIIYCATRKKVEEVAEVLAGWGVKVVAYHGGMDDGEREQAQNVFLSREADVAVATNAFGMGIDRADVRFVIHHEVPGSIEAYYQEAGRAGRDGESAVCELLFNYADTRTQEFFIEGANPGAAVIRDVWRWLRDEADESGEVSRSLDEIAEGVEVRNGMAVGSALECAGAGGLPGALRHSRPEGPGHQAAEAGPDCRRSWISTSRRWRKRSGGTGRSCGRWSSSATAASAGRRRSCATSARRTRRACGWCDVCRGGEAGDERGPTEEEDELVRKAAQRRGADVVAGEDGWHGRFGRGKVVQMLRRQPVAGDPGGAGLGRAEHLRDPERLGHAVT